MEIPCNLKRFSSSSFAHLFEINLYKNGNDHWFNEENEKDQKYTIQIGTGVFFKKVNDYLYQTENVKLSDDD